MNDLSGDLLENRVNPSVVMKTVSFLLQNEVFSRRGLKILSDNESFSVSINRPFGQMSKN